MSDHSAQILRYPDTRILECTSYAGTWAHTHSTHCRLLVKSHIEAAGERDGCRRGRQKETGRGTWPRNICCADINPE